MLLFIFRSFRECSDEMFLWVNCAIIIYKKMYNIFISINLSGRGTKAVVKVNRFYERLLHFKKKSD